MVSPRETSSPDPLDQPSYGQLLHRARRELQERVTSGKVEIDAHGNYVIRLPSSNAGARTSTRQIPRSISAYQVPSSRHQPTDASRAPSPSFATNLQAHPAVPPLQGLGIACIAATHQVSSLPGQHGSAAHSASLASGSHIVAKRAVSDSQSRRRKAQSLSELGLPTQKRLTPQQRAAWSSFSAVPDSLRPSSLMDGEFIWTTDALGTQPVAAHASHMESSGHLSINGTQDESSTYVMRLEQSSSTPPAGARRTLGTFRPLQIVFDLNDKSQRVERLRFSPHSSASSTLSRADSTDTSLTSMMDGITRAFDLSLTLPESDTTRVDFGAVPFRSAPKHKPRPSVLPMRTIGRGRSSIPVASHSSTSMNHIVLAAPPKDKTSSRAPQRRNTHDLVRSPAPPCDRCGHMPRECSINGCSTATFSGQIGSTCDKKGSIRKPCETPSKYSRPQVSILRHVGPARPVAMRRIPVMRSFSAPIHFRNDTPHATSVDGPCDPAKCSQGTLDGQDCGSVECDHCTESWLSGIKSPTLPPEEVATSFSISSRLVDSPASLVQTSSTGQQRVQALCDTPTKCNIPLASDGSIHLECQPGPVGKTLPCNSGSSRSLLWTQVHASPVHTRTQSVKFRKGSNCNEEQRQMRPIVGRKRRGSWVDRVVSSTTEKLPGSIGRPRSVSSINLSRSPSIAQASSLRSPDVDLSASFVSKLEISRSRATSMDMERGRLASPLTDHARFTTPVHPARLGHVEHTPHTRNVVTMSSIPSVKEAAKRAKRHAPRLSIHGLSFALPARRASTSTMSPCAPSNASDTAESDRRLSSYLTEKDDEWLDVHRIDAQNQSFSDAAPRQGPLHVVASLNNNNVATPPRVQSSALKRFANAARQVFDELLIK
ncbi:hypothetical protein IE81DRAFT_346463 [Ceraceosorus guamensis]|uniref:Uncharacterized protein n=1 Tax=Ceraceosorus guamensis TaxID=1522189 RepID=A0A316W0Y3_9BASI|nr:hypothetical protein IE81DRAFT_346463 [Ceraceosorus guamensis]PWN43460.1 hypothetical protein IE81DRAFT_346463 [Ceraceosorus guamensis]